eukprot:CAMPEP_0175833040 /NCGR_PEP_ID=MMETSP0107_2-20121207/15304_1 /TAXON_ID=195067 ORGANISM="Goniomonas pacifica, Strain CCMP1869" /NCGR_SAMPLE_ID=MMETSP0107_2 /ASSEMBLY_ACC=CAM_ASM_000203 /LENGTH=56 /DNA_ID=CAMNT_0017146155 /DNA_START=150 /DNA_END=320 /DNA_ORIENTATION=-
MPFLDPETVLFVASFNKVQSPLLGAVRRMVLLAVALRNLHRMIWQVQHDDALRIQD